MYTSFLRLAFGFPFGIVLLAVSIASFAEQNRIITLSGWFEAIVAVYHATTFGVLNFVFNELIDSRFIDLLPFESDFICLVFIFILPMFKVMYIHQRATALTFIATHLALIVLLLTNLIPGTEQSIITWVNLHTLQGYFFMLLIVASIGFLGAENSRERAKVLQSVGNFFGAQVVLFMLYSSGIVSLIE